MANCLAPKRPANSKLHDYRLVWSHFPTTAAILIRRRRHSKLQITPIRSN